MNGIDVCGGGECWVEQVDVRLNRPYKRPEMSSLRQMELKKEFYKKDCQGQNFHLDKK